MFLKAFLTPWVWHFNLLSGFTLAEAHLGRGPKNAPTRLRPLVKTNTEEDNQIYSFNHRTCIFGLDADDLGTTCLGCSVARVWETKIKSWAALVHLGVCPWIFHSQAEQLFSLLCWHKKDPEKNWDEVNIFSALSALALTAITKIFFFIGSNEVKQK